MEELPILQLQKMYLINQIGHTEPCHFAIRLRVVYFGSWKEFVNLPKIAGAFLN